LSAWRQTVSVCGSTPPTEQNTATGAVEDAQRALDLDREVDVARRVDDVDAVVAPEAGRCGGRDRNAALLLLDHPVHRRGAFVDLADLVVDPRVIEDPLVVVVLPASMWAMMPMLRVFSSGTVLAIALSFPKKRRRSRRLPWNTPNRIYQR
jgi:hypothetical protein